MSTDLSGSFRIKAKAKIKKYGKLNIELLSHHWQTETSLTSDLKVSSLKLMIFKVIPYKLPDEEIEKLPKIKREETIKRKEFRLQNVPVEVSSDFVILSANLNFNGAVDDDFNSYRGSFDFTFSLNKPVRISGESSSGTFIAERIS